MTGPWRAPPIARQDRRQDPGFLEWLTQERDTLAGELGARSRLGIYTLADRIVNLSFRPGEECERSGNRAARVLAAAGVSIEHDPDWVGLIR